MARSTGKGVADVLGLRAALLTLTVGLGLLAGYIVANQGTSFDLEIFGSLVVGLLVVSAIAYLFRSAFTGDAVSIDESSIGVRPGFAARAGIAVGRGVVMVGSILAADLALDPYSKAKPIARMVLASSVAAGVTMGLCVYLFAGTLYVRVQKKTSKPATTCPSWFAAFYPILWFVQGIYEESRKHPIDEAIGRGLWSTVPIAVALVLGWMAYATYLPEVGNPFALKRKAKAEQTT